MRLSVICNSLASAGADRGCVRARPAGRSEQGTDAVDGGEADEAVHDAARDVRLPEVEADDRRHEVELRDCDEAPVEPADQNEGGREQVELLHSCTPPVDLLY